MWLENNGAESWRKPIIAVTGQQSVVQGIQQLLQLIVEKCQRKTILPHGWDSQKNGVFHNVLLKQ